MYSRIFIITVVAFLLNAGTAVIFAQTHQASRPTNTKRSLPERTFEAFWQTFEDHYAFFKLRQINWAAAYQTYRPRINASTSDDSLFSILSQMVAPFKDDHINIIIPNKREFSVVKPSRFLQEFPDPESMERFSKMIDQSLLNNGFEPIQGIGPLYEGKQLFYFTRSADYGYLRMERCAASEETEDKPRADARLAGRILDTVLSHFKNVNGIIIDARNNIGGNDEFAYAVAGRFTTQKVLGHTKQTRKGGYEEFGAPEKWYIKPTGRNPFTKPVLLLINDQTASAGDVLAMIMNVLPQVTLLGENSTGIYSDMYGFELPNKWLASLSHQRYYDVNHICYEGVGTPVDIEIKNSRQDLVTFEDPMIVAAMNFFRKK